MVKALKPLKLKKDSGLWTGLLTHKIVREILEPDSRASRHSLLLTYAQQAYLFASSLNSKPFGCLLGD
jgi:hypothetical protein